MKNLFKSKVTALLGKAGIEINGPNPWDIEVHDEAFYRRAASGSLGFGESYVDYSWTCHRVDILFEKILKADLQNEERHNLLTKLFNKIFNQQTKSKASKNVRSHYGKGNDLYQAFLDKNMIYSCGYWKNAETLEQAQIHKMDLICRKIKLRRGQTILDIGCGWGGFAKYAAEKYRAIVTGVTLEPNQVSFAKEFCKGLPVDIRLQDYRDVKGQFDHIVSVGMFEHVGPKNHKEYFETTRRLLKDYTDDGMEHLFLLHTIGSNTTTTITDLWIDKYIFPGSNIPSIKQISNSLENKFVVEDWHNFGTDYDKTLMEWYKRFHLNWSLLPEKYDKRFYRIWSYYLQSCAGAFRARYMQLWQIVLSKNGVAGGYTSIR